MGNFNEVALKGLESLSPEHCGFKIPNSAMAAWTEWHFLARLFQKKYQPAR
jgi:hypothetical protein